ncbi:MAG: hypothetical protein DCF19_23360 [Pseudanabaena frigida]|uniref:Uncharacterized protein n=1 Tax=Pseudanabaena frigida TaxID=945775 RepID=A0A2W4XIP7_9CYAN|nr:MAG: hypothetical protein DCF19_23360 [Pseudanabaena frigida]
MNPTDNSLATSPAISINGTERWDIYHRLQELEIPCKCPVHKPLTVIISSPNHLIQLWSVMRRINASRQELIISLETNWQIQLDR